MINRFHRLSGFERVVRDHFAGQYKRAGALLAMSLAHRLADRQPRFQRLMSLERVLGSAPGGHPIRVVDTTRNGVRYEFKPWSRIYPLTIRGQFLRDRALYGSPDKVRWMFNGQRSGMQKWDIVKEVRRILTRQPIPQRRHPNHRRWLDALDRIIMVAWSGHSISLSLSLAPLRC